ncbi:MAG: hypothetical protein O3A55_04305 [Bacteroidetes bacterium]|nr:hypothetical protein [Bacteroidota bacterium]
MEKTLTITNNKIEFLHFLKKMFPLFHLSNLFFRDVHYGIIDFLEFKKIKTNYGEAEKIAIEVVKFYEKLNILKKISNNTWVLNYSEFVQPKKAN